MMKQTQIIDEEFTKLKTKSATVKKELATLQGLNEMDEEDDQQEEKVEQKSEAGSDSDKTQ